MSQEAVSRALDDGQPLAVGEPLVDLAARRLGGMVLAASDEFFAPKESLLEPGPAVAVAGRYTDRGKWMDGWETRRRRVPGNDWALVRLGLPGVVRELVVDTAHFRGNHPAACSLEGVAADPDGGVDQLLDQAAAWVELLARTPLEPDREHRFTVEVPRRVTHVRLQIHPDGGVARLRVLGEALPDLRELAGAGGRVDLAAVAGGAGVVGCSDMSFASSGNLLLPGDAVDMGDGWETRRRRGPGHDWAVVRLAAEGQVERVEVGTTHYKGNYPDRCSLEACREPAAGPGEAPVDPEGGWWTLLAPVRLSPHRQHVFNVAEAAGRPATHVRLAIYPDGGVSRLRVIGRISDDGWQRWGLRWLNALPTEQAEAELLACCGSPEWAAMVAAARPFADAAELAAIADEVWGTLGPDDWLDAFAAHPRIGEHQAGSASSRREQAGFGDAGPEVLTALANGNREYERRFGHVFLIRASGRTPEELLAALRARLGNDPEAELRVAAEEQRQITQLRVARFPRP